MYMYPLWEILKMETNKIKSVLNPLPAGSIQLVFSICDSRHQLLSFVIFPLSCGVYLFLNGCILFHSMVPAISPVWHIWVDSSFSMPRAGRRQTFCNYLSVTLYSLVLLEETCWIDRFPHQLKIFICDTVPLDYCTSLNASCWPVSLSTLGRSI